MSRFDRAHLAWSTQVDNISAVDWQKAADQVAEERVIQERNSEKRTSTFAAPAEVPTSPIKKLDQIADLLAEAAHDIRSPIATASQIISAVSMRARQALRPRAMHNNSQLLTNLSISELDLLDHAHNRLREANSWIEGILIESRLRQEGTRPIRCRFYPQQWRTVAAPLLQHHADSKGIRLVWKGWDRSLPTLYLDPNQLSRAVLNLVANAVDASEPGQEIQIFVIRNRRNRNQIRLSITDQAGGMPEHLKERINSPYLQSIPNRQEGLGLHTAKTLIYGLGGNIQATDVSQGTRMILNLPIDHFQTLLVNWISGLDNNHTKAQSAVVIHLIRASNLLRKAEFDRALQMRADQNLVYRLTSERWLCLALEKTSATQQDRAWLDEFCEHQQSTNPNSKIRHIAGAIIPLTDQLNAIRWQAQLTQRIDREVKWLIGDLIPRIEQLPAQARLSPNQTSSNHSKSSDAHPPLPPAPLASGAKNRTPNSVLIEKETADNSGAIRPRKKHLPRPTGRSNAVAQDARMYRALRELAGHWRTQQTKLHRVHSAENTISAPRI